MLRFQLNLATNPFVNYRKYYLAGVALLLIGVAGAGYSARHYLDLHRLTRLMSQDLQKNQSQLNQLIEHEADLKAQLERPQTLDEIDRIAFYNLLIQRKVFPWTPIFQDLESVIPYNVQVTQIRQKTVGKSIDLEMVFMGRSTADAINFLRNLTSSKKFHDIVVNQEGAFREAATHRISSEVEVTLHMQYEP